MNRQFLVVVAVICFLLLIDPGQRLQAEEVAQQVFSGEVLQVKGQRLQLKLVSGQIIWLTLDQESLAVKPGDTIKGHYMPLGDALVATGIEPETEPLKQGGSNEQ